MKKTNLSLYCFLAFFCGFLMVAQAQNYPYDDDEEYARDLAWKKRGFEFYIGGGIYFASKATANYYNGDSINDIKLNLLFSNKYRREELLNLLRNEYRYMDTMVFNESYNHDSRYSIAMDISLGARYRFNKNWFGELSYSFRRISCENKFNFDLPGGVPGNKENPPYTDWEFIIAKEDRHYIDLSVGYIFQKHPIAKPFLALGVQFNYVNIKSFLAIVEKTPFDLMEYARHPNWVPGYQEMPNYRVWAGAGYGFSFTAGLKLAVNQSVSLDPIFQLSVGSFGNSNNLPGFNNDLCFNYMAGVRIVINDALFFKNTN